MSGIAGGMIRRIASATSSCPTAGRCRWRCTGAPTHAALALRPTPPTVVPRPEARDRHRRQAVPPFVLPGGAVERSVHARELRHPSGGNGRGRVPLRLPGRRGDARGGRRFAPTLERCGPKARRPAVRSTRNSASPSCRSCWWAAGASRAPCSWRTPHYRSYLFELVAGADPRHGNRRARPRRHVNGVPYIAFRSLSDLAGGDEFNADVGALFASGLAESERSRGDAGVPGGLARAARGKACAMRRRRWTLSPRGAAGAVRAGVGAAGGARRREPLKVLMITHVRPEAQPWIEPFALSEECRCRASGPSTRRCVATPTTCACSPPAWATRTPRPRRSPSRWTRALDLRPPVSSWPASPASTRRMARSARGLGALAGRLRHRPRDRCARDAAGLAQRLPRHHDQGPGREAQFEYHTEAARLDEALLQKALRLSRGGRSPTAMQARAYRAQLPQRAGESAAAGDPMRHAGRRDLVAWPPPRPARSRLDAAADRRRRGLLHHAAGRQRHLQRAGARQRRRPGRPEAPRSAAHRHRTSTARIRGKAQPRCGLPPLARSGGFIPATRISSASAACSCATSSRTGRRGRTAFRPEPVHRRGIRLLSALPTNHRGCTMSTRDGQA